MISIVNICIYKNTKRSIKETSLGIFPLITYTHIYRVPENYLTPSDLVTNGLTFNGTFNDEFTHVLQPDSGGPRYNDREHKLLTERLKNAKVEQKTNLTQM